MTKQDIEKLNQSLAEDSKKAAELKVLFSKAVDEMPKESIDIKQALEYIGYRIDFLHERIDRTNKAIGECMNAHYDYVYNHEKGHFPSMSVSQMKKALVKLGLDEDFNVIPNKTIYASINNRKSTIEVELKK